MTKMTKLVWVKTTYQLPAYTQELLGYGDGLSQNLYGMYSIMRYDGCWWSADGTELSDPPEYWAYLRSPHEQLVPTDLNAAMNELLISCSSLPLELHSDGSVTGTTSPTALYALIAELKNSLVETHAQLTICREFIARARKESDRVTLLSGEVNVVVPDWFMKDGN